MSVRLPLVLIASAACGFCGCTKRAEEAPPAAQTTQAATAQSNQTTAASGTTTNFESQTAPAAPASDEKK